MVPGTGPKVSGALPGPVFASTKAQGILVRQLAKGSQGPANTSTALVQRFHGSQRAVPASPKTFLGSVASGADEIVWKGSRSVVRDVEIDVCLNSSSSPCAGLQAPHLDFYLRNFSDPCCAQCLCEVTTVEVQLWGLTSGAT